mmetsp:Transcript_52357/g.125395  ORF Transcript_52357/g.125395 Transcript_52357/m.125395 type:complete len:208 (-) Transcript_52357:8-631(-)
MYSSGAAQLWTSLASHASQVRDARLPWQRRLRWEVGVGGLIHLRGIVKLEEQKEAGPGCGGHVRIAVVRPPDACVGAARKRSTMLVFLPCLVVATQHGSRNCTIRVQQLQNRPPHVVDLLAELDLRQAVLELFMRLEQRHNRSCSVFPLDAVAPVAEAHSAEIFGTAAGRVSDDILVPGEQAFVLDGLKRRRYRRSLAFLGGLCASQ